MDDKNMGTPDKNTETPEKTDFISKIGHKLGLSHLKSDKAKRNKTIAIAIVSIIFFSIILALFLKSTTPKVHKIHLAHINIIPPSSLAKHNWIVNNSAALHKQSSQLKSLESTVKSLKKHLKKAQTLQSLKKPAFGSFTPPAPPMYNGNGQLLNNRGVVSKPKAKPIFRTTTGLIGSVSLVIKKKSGVPLRRSNIPGKTLKQTSTSNNMMVKKSHKANILPGSFARVTLLTGAEVPTNGGGSVGPVPVLMRVISDDQLPNFFKTNIQNCFVLGQAKGSLSSGRAYIRLSHMSCVSKNGQDVSLSISATAVGEDGKVGLAGKVVTKQGAILARVLVAGFLQGVGSAFQQSTQDVSVSPLTGGATSAPITPSTGNLLTLGIGGGVSQATQQLAKFYMNMANKMFPVIQLNAGRTVDIMFLRSAYLP